jgi:hypothetical protein
MESNRMFAKLQCVAQQHNIWLVLMAAVVCATATSTALRMMVDDVVGNGRIAGIAAATADQRNGSVNHWDESLNTRNGRRTGHSRARETRNQPRRSP